MSESRVIETAGFAYWGEATDIVGGTYIVVGANDEKEGWKPAGTVEHQEQVSQMLGINLTNARSSGRLPNLVIIPDEKTDGDETFGGSIFTHTRTKDPDNPTLGPTCRYSRAQPFELDTEGLHCWYFQTLRREEPEDTSVQSSNRPNDWIKLFRAKQYLFNQKSEGKEKSNEVSSAGGSEWPPGLSKSRKIDTTSEGAPSPDTDADLRSNGTDD